MPGREGHGADTLPTGYRARCMYEVKVAWSESDTKEPYLPRQHTVYFFYNYISFMHHILLKFY